MWVQLAVGLLAAAGSARATIGQPSCVAFESSSATSFSVVSNSRAAPVWLSSDDWPGVQRAATDFAADIQRVTGVAPALANYTANATGDAPIIVGTLGKSSLIDAIVNGTKWDVSALEGKWEAFQSKVVADPVPGVSKAYVIVGSDKRGTIFALYEHSEQFGVSPWYWWADAPVQTHDALFVSDTGCAHGEPSVKYRGIFLNDEQPALQNWALEKFTNGTGSAAFNSPFNAAFYAKVFELLLRLKANYLWPAMWGSAFAVDDPNNQPLADLFGIVMGTSHQEPMARSSPNEWNIYGGGTPWNYTSNSEKVYEYWVNGTQRARPYETLYTLGMRGAGDLPLGEDTNIKLLQKVVEDQRKILSDVYNGTDVATIPQLWALYKEVQGYYEDGMRVPDDVTLLWTDDNWGNIRRYPLASERNRTGGAGIYYHFDYVGDPRDYKWISTTQISKVYEQMSLAIETKADRIWIVNVGDLKPFEREIEFFVSLGYDASKWNLQNLDSFLTGWAQRDLGVDATDSATVAHIVSETARFNARRKPELWNSTTYSLWDYREAESVLASWKSLTAASTALYNTIPSEYKPAFFQLVHHPVQASATLAEMYIAAGVNALRATQARASANQYADRVEELFEKDYDLEVEYHSLLDGKWDHFMDQTHVGYSYWQQPMVNSMPSITRVQTKKQALSGPLRIVPEGYRGAWPGDNPYQCALGYNCPPPSLSFDRYLPQGTKFIDVGSGGPVAYTFTASSNATWLTLTPASGSISPENPEQRVEVGVDWSKLTGAGTATVTFTASPKGSAKQNFAVYVYANHTTVPEDFKGFVEGDGGISIEAAHASRNTSVGGVTWAEIPNYGRTLSGVTPWPRLGNDGRNYTAGSGPSIEYDFYNFNTLPGGLLAVTAYVSPSLNANGNDRPLGIALQIDNLAPVTKYFIPYAPATTTPAGWGGPDGFVANSIVSIPASFKTSPGKHTLKVWMIEPAVVLQKLVINTANVRTSYLGPPESIII